MKFLFIVFCFIFNLISSITFCQGIWELAKEKNGIQIFTRDVGSKGFKEFKTVATFTGVSLHNIFAAFKDVDNANEWTCNLKKSSSLKEYSETHYINYFEISVPWPLRNRDAVFNVKAFQDPIDKSLNIHSNIDTDFLPENENNVRVIASHGFWKFTPIGFKTIRVECELYADPRGLPAWIVNLFAIDGPYNSIIGLEKQVKKDKYKTRTFDFILDQDELSGNSRKN